MFFPYRDDNPQVLIPYVTYGILALNVLVFLYQTLFLADPVASHAFTLRYGLIPQYFWQNNAPELLLQTEQMMSRYEPRIAWDALGQINLLPAGLTLLTAPFLHGGWLHLLGNLLFLYVFADNVEGALGHRKFALFYLFAALAAGFAQLYMVPESMLPVVGASGAISGVLGAYMLRYPKARIHVFVFFVIIFTTIRLPAFVVLGWWFAIQAFNGILSMSSEVSGGIAWFEHIGGFVAGLSFMAIAGRRRKLVLKV